MPTDRRLPLMLGVALGSRTDCRAVLAPPFCLRQLHLFAPALVKFWVCRLPNLECGEEAHPCDTRIAFSQRAMQFLALAPDRRFYRSCLIGRIYAQDFEFIDTRIKIVATLRERADFEMARLHFNGCFQLKSTFFARHAHQQLHP